MPDTQVPVLFRLFWIAPILGGALLALPSFNALREAEASAHWPRVSGEITVPLHHYEPQYTWEYRGTRYTGERIACCGGDIRKIPGARDRGTRVDVYVNPDDPTRAVLLPGVQPSCVVRIVAGIGLIAMGVWVRRRILVDDERRGRGF